MACFTSSHQARLNHKDGIAEIYPNVDESLQIFLSFIILRCSRESLLVLFQLHKKLSGGRAR